MCTEDSKSSWNTDSSDVVYYDPTHDKSNEECWKCWKLPTVRYQKDVIIQNPKYCWMYSREERKKLKKLVPNFEDINTLYTKCDYRLEACTHETILKLESLLKYYEKLFKKEIKVQRNLIDKVWEKSFRYTLLTNSTCCVKYYPEIISRPTEHRALCDFYETLSKVNQSICRINEPLIKIRQTVNELNDLYAQLDKTVESPIIIGKGASILPLSQIHEMINDVYKYFYTSVCKLKTWAQLIDPSSSTSVDDYRYLLQSLDDLDGFLMFVEKDCTCRRTRKHDCLKNKRPC